MAESNVGNVTRLASADFGSDWRGEPRRVGPAAKGKGPRRLTWWALRRRFLWIVWHDLEIDEVAGRLRADASAGLTLEEVRARLAEFGRNEIAEPEAESLWRIVGRLVADPLVLLLVVASAVSGFILSEWIEASAIVAIVALNTAIGAAQEGRAATALAGLRNLSPPYARVIRASQEKSVPAVELVPGDLILLAAGDRTPADARLLESIHLSVDESALTGESLPVDKDTKPSRGDAPVAERYSTVHAGTSVSAGRGRALVVATGAATEMGRIASLLAEEEPSTPLQKELARVGRRIAAAALVVAAVIFILGIARQEPVEQFFLVAVALAVAAIPEGLPTVVTLSLARGVQELAKAKAIARRLYAVETLGSAQVICTDKTGTLTRNEIWLQEAEFAGLHLSSLDALTTDPRIRQFVEIAALCSDAAFTADGYTGDPTEIALRRAIDASVDVDQIRRDRPRLDEVAFDANRKLMSTLHAENGGWVLMVKGAPESVIVRCTEFLDQSGIESLPSDRAERALAVAAEMASRGLRTLALAYRKFRERPSNLGEAEVKLVLVGVAGMRDELRPESPGSINEARAAGIKVVMVTGDHEVTARTIAQDLELTGRVMTGRQLHELSDEQLAAEVEAIAVFARVDPEDKVRIVRAWQQRGAVVAMTGDGVNDAPALRLADIGIAMGSGTDVAREAAALVLTDDNFATIVGAIRHGRRIFANLRNVVTFLLAANLSEVLTMFGGLLLFPALGEPLRAVQLLWVNLITDGLPALALGMDAGGSALMDRPPRKERSLLGLRRQLRLLAYGAAIAAGVLTVYALGGDDPPRVRTMGFTTLVLAQMIFVLRVRVEGGGRPGRNRFLQLAIISSVLLQIAVVHTPLGNRVFDSVPLRGSDWLLVGGGLLVAGAALEVAVRVRRSPTA